MIRTIIENIKSKNSTYLPKSTAFNHFKDVIQRGNFEGIVLLGAGGNQDEWIKGITELLAKEEVVKVGIASDIFMGAYSLTTSGGRTDLALVFNTAKKNIDIGKMAMWRLRFGDTSWISDYLVNYADQHSTSK